MMKELLQSGSTTNAQTATHMPFDEFFRELTGARRETDFRVGKVDIPLKELGGRTFGYVTYSSSPSVGRHPGGGLALLLRQNMVVRPDTWSSKCGLQTNLADVATEFAYLIISPANGTQAQVVARVLGGPTGVEVQYQPAAAKYLPI